MRGRELNNRMMGKHIQLINMCRKSPLIISLRVMFPIPVPATTSIDNHRSGYLGMAKCFNVYS